MADNVQQKQPGSEIEQDDLQKLMQAAVAGALVQACSEWRQEAGSPAATNALAKDQPSSSDSAAAKASSHQLQCP